MAKISFMIFPGWYLCRTSPGSSFTVRSWSQQTGNQNKASSHGESMETLVSNDNNLLQDVSKKLHQTTAAGRESQRTGNRTGTDSSGESMKTFKKRMCRQWVKQIFLQTTPCNMDIKKNTFWGPCALVSSQTRRRQKSTSETAYITLKGGIANLERSHHHLPCVFAVSIHSHETDVRPLHV